MKGDREAAPLPAPVSIMFEAEPRCRTALFNRRNVVLLPHVASATTKRDRRWPILPSKISPLHFAGKTGENAGAGAGGARFSP